MKKLLLNIVLLLTPVIYSQELPKIAPPSPNASALHVYGNTQVNYYTGAPNISIPIYTINEGDLTLPIYLKYTGGNGIKVTEEATWTGLGWTLNAGGAISRTKRGRNDEDEHHGLFKLNEIPRPNNNESYQTFLDIGEGLKDAEPDVFFFNTPSVSGKFFFDHNEKTHLKPKKNIDIQFYKGRISNSSAVPPLLSGHNVINNFKLIDESGLQYTFNDVELSNTVAAGDNYTDNRGFPSTWYLSKMNSPKTNSEINFQYESYPYSNVYFSGSFSDNTSTNEIIQRNKTYYLGQYLKKIDFSSGYVEFILGNSFRKDMKNSKYLEYILVRNKNHKLVKKFKLEYKYFTKYGLKDEHLVSEDFENNRLCLTSIKEISTNNSKELKHSFVYNNEFILPGNNSKATDHWGYYNGKNNSKYEPKYYHRYYHLEDGWTIKEFGSADKNPSSEHAKAGILKEIIYPTGGKTVFTYEGHKASSIKLPNEIKRKSKDLIFQNESVTMDIELFSESFPVTPVELRFEGMLEINSGQCYPVVHIKNNSTQQIQRISFESPQAAIKKILLPKGIYSVWFVLKSKISNDCHLFGELTPLTISWFNEVNSNESLIGGVRIQSITNISNTSQNTVTKFNYVDELGNTTGEIISVPKYMFHIGYSNISKPIYWKRFTQSQYPLLTTQGSHVGYSIVTKTNLSTSGGKTIYKYTTAKNFPDGLYGTDKDKSPLNTGHYGGYNFNTYPVAEYDSKEFLRGKLLEQIDYKFFNGTYSKVRTVKNEYRNLYNKSSEYEPLLDFIEDEIHIVEGIKSYVSRSQNGGVAAVDYKYYHLYTGYSLPLISQDTTFYNNGKVVAETKNIYQENEDGFIRRFFPIEKIASLNSEEFITTKTSYAYDLNNQRLISEHRIAEPIKVETFKNNTPISKQETTYDSNHNPSGNLYLPKSIQTSKGTKALEDRIVYHRYDNKGNPVEVSKKDGTKIYYVWGYQQTQPIAKIEGYTAINTTQQIAINNAIGASNNDTSASAENTLRTKLNALRTALGNTSKVTTYTYDPLIGVTSITDPRGETLYYEYDDFNRLQYIKDAQKNILKEHRYNYKN